MTGERTLGVVATSRKPDERRLPIHPAHLDRLDPALRRRLFLERGYGERFGVDDAVLARQVGGLRSRDELLDGCDVVVLPKPAAEDLAQRPAGTVLWGWPHCVQDFELTQVAIDRRLTVIAWEAMNHWTDERHFNLHVFHRNNELAGYSAVLHALGLVGRTGAYGRRLRAAVIGFGATGRGALSALAALSVHDVHVLTHRRLPTVTAPAAPARLIHYEPDPQPTGPLVALTGAGRTPLAEFLAGHDVVVNCVLQDTDHPLVFVRESELDLFTPGSLIVDVSADTGMGFEWARPTSFAAPLRTLGDWVRYYAVDHTPSYLWDSATWDISEALIPFVGTVMGTRADWDADATIRHAIEIRDGVVQNPKILSFQSRDPSYPHRTLAATG